MFQRVVIFNGFCFTEEKSTRKRHREESHDILAGYIKRLKSASANTDQSESQAAIESLRQEIENSDNLFIKSLIAC